MIPKTLSASSLQVADACLARWVAEYFHRASGPGGVAANLGTAVHGGLELYVKAVYMEKTHEPSLQLLLDLYKMSYITTFDSANLATEEFMDGVEMCDKWFKRTSFDGFTVLSAERKDTFPIKTSAGDIPFNYIWDRADQLGPDEFRIVDYKTIRLPISPAGLKEKIQPRCYGLAGQIQFPQAKRIWVQFDLLRHDPVGIVFSREDNIATWNFLKASAERLIATDENDPPEKLNPDCRYCVRAASCNTLKKNAMVGGIFSITDPNEAVERRAEVKYAITALEKLGDDLDKIILKHAEHTMSLEWETPTTKVEITAARRRGIDAERASRIIGDELMREYGQLRMGDIDKLLRPANPQLTDEQKAQLKALIYKTTGEPGVKVSPVSPLDD